MRKLLLLLFSMLSLCITAVKITKIPSTHISEQKMKQNTKQIRKLVKTSFNKQIKNYRTEAIIYKFIKTGNIWKTDITPVNKKNQNFKITEII